MTLRPIASHIDTGVSLGGSVVPFADVGRSVATSAKEPDDFPDLSADMAKKQAKEKAIKEESEEGALDDIQEAMGWLINSTNLAGGCLTLVPKVSVKALKFIGVVGAALTLTYDGLSFAERVKTCHEIEKLKNQIPDELRFKKIFFEAIHRYSQILVANSSAEVTIDVLTVIASFCPIMCLPVDIASFVISIGKIAAENRAGKILKSQLEALASKYIEQNEEMILGKKTLKDQCDQLKIQHEQAKAVKENTAQALEEASMAMRQLPHKQSILLHQKATQKDLESEQALKKIETQLHISKNSLINIEVYEHLANLIREFDPLVKKEFNLKNAIEKYEKEHPEVLEKDGAKKWADKLENNIKDINHELFVHKLNESGPFFFDLHYCEYTEKQKEQIPLLQAQWDGLNAYRKNLDELDNVKQEKVKREQVQQAKLAEMDLSSNHFKTPSNTHHTTPHTKVTIHSPRPIPTLKPTFVSLRPELFKTPPSTSRTKSKNTVTIHSLKPAHPLNPIVLTPELFRTSPSTQLTSDPRRTTIHYSKSITPVKPPSPLTKSFS